MKKAKLFPPDELILRDLRKRKIQRKSGYHSEAAYEMPATMYFNKNAGQTILSCLDYKAKLNYLDTETYQPTVVPDQLICLP